jgi:hypothetical protein
MLANIIERVKVDAQIDCVISRLVDGGISILQYAEDTIHFMKYDFEKARNLKF